MFLLPRGLAAGPFLWSVLRRLARAVTLPRAVVRFECSRALRDDDGRFLNPRASLPFRWWRKNLWPNNRPGSCVVLELDCAVWPPRSALLNGYAVLHVLGLLVAECQVFKPGLLAPCVALPRDAVGHMLCQTMWREKGRSDALERPKSACVHESVIRERPLG